VVSIEMIFMGLTFFTTIVLCDVLDWHKDGVSILGSVPIHTGTFIAFPLRHRNLAYVQKTTSTAL
jgi:hypothetical protein